MGDVILILTNSKDGRHTDVVTSKLQQRGQKTFRFDSDIFANSGLRLNFSTGRDGFGFEIVSTTSSISSKEVKSVWYRRPNFFNLGIGDPIQRTYAEEEIKNLTEGLWMSMPDVFWLNDPFYLSRARRKIYQLFLAREAGFTVPKTIITNNPETVRKFYDECGGKIIFKAIQGELLDYGKKSLSIPTTFITGQHLKNLALIERTPALFQEYIERAYELRITQEGVAIKSYP